MTYSITGHWYIGVEPINKKSIKSMLNKLNKRHKNKLADILIINPKQSSERRIQQYIDNNKIVIKYENCYNYLLSNHPELFL